MDAHKDLFRHYYNLLLKYEAEDKQNIDLKEFTQKLYEYPNGKDNELANDLMLAVLDWLCREDG